MAIVKRFLPLIPVIVIGIILQGVLVAADCKQTPYKAATAFLKAYYKQDPALSQRLCSDLAGDNGADVATDYLQHTKKRAHDLGFQPGFMKNKLVKIHTHTTFIDDTNATVRVTAKKRRSLNPAFNLVAQFFSLGKTHPVDETIRVVKEEGKWKVCDSPFFLSSL